MEWISCLNCGHKVELDFCPSCGQKATTRRISVGSLLKDLPHAIFHIDKGFLFNVIHLFRRPGAAIRDYLAGKRKSFFHPATFLVISLVLNYVVVVLTDLHFYDEGELARMSPLEAKAIQDYDAMQWWFLQHTYLYIFLAIPMSALFMWGLMKVMRETFNVAESAVIILFVISEGVLIQTTIYALLGWVESGAFRRGLESVNMTCLVSYAAYAIFKLFTSSGSLAGRLAAAIVGGLGLAAVWILGALCLYYLFG